MKFFNGNAVSWIALFVSITSAIFAYDQSITSKAQLKLNELQIRPYLRYMPFFFEGKREINIEMHLENQSTVPSRVVYTELTGWVGETTTGVNLHSTAEEILFQHKGGRSSLPPIIGELAKELMNGDSVLQIGSCVIYAPVSKNDLRRWELISLNQYDPGEGGDPTTVFMQEVEVPTEKNKCLSKEIRGQWLRTRMTTK